MQKTIIDLKMGETNLYLYVKFEQWDQRQSYAEWIPLSSVEQSKWVEVLDKVGK